MNFVITIGRQYGSGGRFIARKLAEELNINYYDNELLAKASLDSGMSQAVIESYDEKKDGFFSGVIPSTFSVDLSMGQKVFLSQFETIKHIAETESCVIVGRCADYVLSDFKNVVNVFIDAPLDDRVKRAVEYYNIEPKKAKDVVIKMDKKRSAYYNFYTDKKWGKAECYDLCVNSNVGVDEAVKIIKAFVEAKLKITL